MLHHDVSQELVADRYDFNNLLNSPYYIKPLALLLLNYATSFTLSMSTARWDHASPSVTLEKGAYRIRAPRVWHVPSTPHRARTRNPDPFITHEKQIAILIVVLASATVSCFGTAYYLFTTRWASVELIRIPSILTTFKSSHMIRTGVSLPLSIADILLSSCSHAVSFKL